MLADGNGVVVRDPITNAVVRVDDQGNPYVMTGIFGTKKTPIDKSVVFDRSVDPLPNITTSVSTDDEPSIVTPVVTQLKEAPAYDPVSVQEGVDQTQEGYESAIATTASVDKDDDDEEDQNTGFTSGPQ